MILSEKRKLGKYGLKMVYPEEDVKEFIKESNEDLDLVRIGKMSISKFIRRFKQRAGEDLK